MGTRMGAAKQLMILGTKPVLAHTIEAFDSHKDVDDIIVVAPENVAGAVRAYGYKKLKAVVPGGAERQASVWAGLSALDGETGPVLIHDGARPLVTQKVISDILSCVRQGKAAVSGVISKDTIKIADAEGFVKDTPKRELVWLVQTPQGFPCRMIKEAHQQAINDGFVGTDDAGLVERMGIPVLMVKGDYRNIKLTTPEDLQMAEALLHI